MKCEIEEKVSLNSIIEQEYEKGIGRKLYKGENKDSNYDEFRSRQTKKIIKIFKLLGCDFEDFRVSSKENSSFEIPITVAEICRVYISGDSSKGSAISNIHTGNFLKVKLEDKIKLLDRMEANLKEKTNYELDDYFTILRHEIEDSERVKDVIKGIQDSIETLLLEFGGIDGREGLVGVVNTDKKVSEFNNEIKDFEEYMEKIDSVEVTAKMKLNNPDKLVLMEYLETFLGEKIKDWLRIVDIAGEIREGDLEDYTFENIGMLTSEELLEEAIKEFENEKNLERESIKVHTEERIHTPEEIKEILEEIKKNLKK